MKEGLELLFTLQQQDDKIIEIQNLIKEIPAEIKKLEDERDGKASIIEKTKEKLSINIKEREKLEKEILLIKEKINKYKDQMSKATTNKEYQGFMAEIKYEENSIASVEEKIIEKMVDSDEIMSEIRESEAEFEKIVSNYNKKITDMTASMGFSKQKLSEHLKEKNSIREKISPKLLRVYDNLFLKKNGKAVSLVETEFCGVCNVMIRPQYLLELVTTDQMKVCENCGRILYKALEAPEDGEETQN